jgi:hypothetical protein
MAKGILIPWCSDCDRNALLQAVAIVGAVSFVNIFCFVIVNLI